MSLPGLHSPMVSIEPPRIGLSVPNLALPPPSLSTSYPGYVPGTQHAAGMPPIHAGMGPNQVAELVDVLTKTVAHLQGELATVADPDMNRPVSIDMFAEA